MNAITKGQFVSILEGAQITEAQRNEFHALFERRHPEAHAAFLRWLGIADKEVEQIREHARAHA